MSSVNPHIVAYIYNVLVTLKKDDLTVLLYDVIQHHLTSDGMCPCDLAPSPHSEEGCPVLMNGDCGRELIDLMSDLHSGEKPNKCCFHCLVPYSYNVIPHTSPLHIPHTNHQTGEENHCEDLQLTPLFISSLKLLLIPEICGALRFPSGQHGFVVQDGIEYCKQDWRKVQGFTNLHLLFLINHFLYYAEAHTPYDAKKLLASFNGTPVTSDVELKATQYLKDITNFRSGAQGSKASIGNPSGGVRRHPIDPLRLNLLDGLSLQSTPQVTARGSDSYPIPELLRRPLQPPFGKGADRADLLPPPPTPNSFVSTPKYFDRPLKARPQGAARGADSHSISELLRQPLQPRSQAGAHLEDPLALHQNLFFPPEHLMPSASPRSPDPRLKTTAAKRHSPYESPTLSKSGAWTAHSLQRTTEVTEEVQPNGDRKVVKIITKETASYNF